MSKIMSEAIKEKWKDPEYRKKFSGKNHWSYGKPRSEATKQKISIANAGKNHPMYGKHHSLTSRKNLSIAMQKRKERDGYMNSPEARKKMSDSQKGKKRKPFSEEHRKRISDSVSGKNNGMWNPNRSEVCAPYGPNFCNRNLRKKKWNLQRERDILTGNKLDKNKWPAYHYIDYDKSNDDPDNHCFLSSNNHSKITGCQRNLIKSKKYKQILRENAQDLKDGLIPRHWNLLNKETFRQEKLKQLNLISCVI